MDVLFVTFLSTLRLADPHQEGNLTIYPVIRDDADHERRYATLDEAMQKGAVKVSETGGGEVPTLQLKNESKEPLFVMTGDLLQGAKQDRISAHDVLLDPATKTAALSVYCVEQGRWHGSSSSFGSGMSTATKSVRKAAALKESQGQIWEHVAAKSAAAHVHSPTGTFSAVVDSPAVKKGVERYTKALIALASETENMVGFVAVIDGQVASADVFANRPLFLAVWPKLLRSAAIDAATEKAHGGGSSADAFLKTAAAAKLEQLKNPGRGSEYKVKGDNGLGGSVLFSNDGALVHGALFAK